jgi:hypothetical protein
MKRILVISDIHYAGEAEQAREAFETRAIGNPFLRALVAFYRHFIWLRAPTQKNHLLDQCLRLEPDPDWVVANGDYSCDSAFVGVSDPAARASAAECLAVLRQRYGGRFLAILGDHELGKKSLCGGNGGLRLDSLDRSISELGLEIFWQMRLGRYALTGVTSSLIALPAYEPETLPEEREAWHVRRQAHLNDLKSAWTALTPDTRIILFCHDPTALPFLWREQFVRERAAQIERTIIGHLHSPLVLWMSRRLCGMPVIGFLGGTVRRLSGALRAAAAWKHFNISLCPSLAGIELLKDGGCLILELDPEGEKPLCLIRRRLHR